MTDNRLGCVVALATALVACSSESAPSGPGSAAQGSGSAGTSATSGATGGSSSTTTSAGAGTTDTTGGAGGAATSGAGGSSSSAGGAGGAIDGGGSGGSPVADAAGGSDAPRPMGGCSQPLRNGVMPGKESFTVLTPNDTHFPFTKHWVGVFSINAAGVEGDQRFIGGESLTDLDNDGDLDYAIGQRTDVGGGMVWFEYCGEDQWVRHPVGTGHRTTAGGGAMDVNGDGFVDLVMSDSWYQNPGMNTNNVRMAASWQRYVIKNLNVEENIIGDVNNDKKADLLYFMTGLNSQWWTPGANPTQQWTTGNIFSMHPTRQGGAVGDIDGDGKNDILNGNQWWYRNVNGDGMMWEEVRITEGSMFDAEPLTHLGDLDGDGDMDLVMITHWGGETGARFAWFENVDGKGKSFTMHQLDMGLGWLHTVVAADFDNDGDLDVYVGKNVGPQWIWENDGKGHLTKHTAALDFRGHNAKVGDVDCDGDLDVVGSPWGDPNEGGEATHPPRDAVYLKNMCVEMGTCQPLFVRPKEVTFQKEWPYVCKR
jgi:hypothetical protein